jgi:Holliday junction DNA helicase RuvA
VVYYKGQVFELFYSIKGSVEAVLDNAAVIECGGVGYLIQASMNTLAELSGKAEAKLYTVLQVRENDVSLIGFANREDLRIFELLTSVSGVGTKAALSIQSTLSASEIVLAVLTDDDKMLSRAPGVGKKIAQRLALELKSKFKATGDADDYKAFGTANNASSANTPKQEAVEALVVLSFSRGEAVKTVAEVALDGMSVEEIIKEALKKMRR